MCDYIVIFVWLVHKLDNDSFTGVIISISLFLFYITIHLVVWLYVVFVLFVGKSDKDSFRGVIISLPLFCFIRNISDNNSFSGVILYFYFTRGYYIRLVAWLYRCFYSKINHSITIHYSLLFVDCLQLQGRIYNSIFQMNSL